MKRILLTTAGLIAVASLGFATTVTLDVSTPDSCHTEYIQFNDPQLANSDISDHGTLVEIAPNATTTFTVSLPDGVASGTVCNIPVLGETHWASTHRMHQGTYGTLSFTSSTSFGQGSEVTSWTPSLSNLTNPTGTSNDGYWAMSLSTFDSPTAPTTRGNAIVGTGTQDLCFNGYHDDTSSLSGIISNLI